MFLFSSQMNGEGHHITSLKPTEMKKVWMDNPNYSKYKDPRLFILAQGRILVIFVQ